ncbi:acetyl-CoA synthetase [Streptomyces sp. NPDC004658]|uniref:acetyl-CoA synthetase n=1 Tax=Streptomyces sp. NPDC004658 TaxID=3154672 RepID=UPI0033AEA1F2
MGSAPTVSSAPSAPAPPTSPAPPATASSAPATGCVARRTEVAVAPGDPPRRRLCVRPGTVVSLVLRPRADDKRWTAVRSSAPVFVLVSGWRVDADGTAHASLRAAGTRGGDARVTALAKAPDVAGVARVAFTLDMTVSPYAREG